MHTAVMLATLPAVLAQGYLKTDSDLVFTGQMQWILLLVGLGIVGVIALKFITKARTERAQKRKRSAVQGSKSQAFLDRAQHLGFRQNEARMVARIARRSEGSG